MTVRPAYLTGLPPRITRHRFEKRDTILYALGVGCGQDTSCPLKYIYEDGLQALPTMAVVLAYPGFWQKEPQYGLDWKRIRHGEQSVRFHKPLPVEGRVRGEMKIERVVDKGPGKGALLYATRRIYEEPSDALLATVEQVSFIQGGGGCGGLSEVTKSPHPVPKRAPEKSMTLTTRPEQALIYRLSGDYNPLHIDPKVAREACLDRPILHGLCTYGISATGAPS